MLVVGLTGNIGSGKSTIARVFSALGVPVFNSDEVAKNAYFVPSIQNEVREILGSVHVLQDDSSKGPVKESQIDFSKETWKSEIAAIIFSNEEKRLRIESLIHAYVQSEFTRWKAEQNSKYVIREAALSASFKEENCDWLIEVIAERETRMKRVLQRSGLTEEEFKKRDDLQKANETFPKNKILCLQNNESDRLLEGIIELHKQLNA